MYVCMFNLVLQYVRALFEKIYLKILKCWAFTCSTSLRSSQFYVLLTVHLGIIPVNDQPGEQFFFRICLFQIPTWFEHSCAYHQEN